MPRRASGSAVERSDSCSEFNERDSDAEMTVAGVGAEFVVAAAEVLDERVTANHYRRAAVGFEAAHRSEPGLESGVVAFDAVVIRYDMGGRFGLMPIRVLGSVGRVRGVPEE